MKIHNHVINGEYLLAIILPIVVTLHLEVKDLGLRSGGRGDKVGLEQLEDAVTDLGKLSLDLSTVVLDERDPVVIAAALLLLFNGGDNAPRGTACSNHILVRNREEVALLDSELLGVDSLGHLLHKLDHLLVPLGLLGELGHVHVLLPGKLHWCRHLHSSVSKLSQNPKSAGSKRKTAVS